MCVGGWEIRKAHPRGEGSLPGGGDPQAGSAAPRRPTVVLPPLCALTNLLAPLFSPPSQPFLTCCFHDSMTSGPHTRDPVRVADAGAGAAAGAGAGASGGREEKGGLGEWSSEAQAAACGSTHATRRTEIHRHRCGKRGGQRARVWGGGTGGERLNAMQSRTLLSLFAPAATPAPTATATNARTATDRLRIGGGGAGREVIKKKATGHKQKANRSEC